MMEELNEKILGVIEKNSKISIADLALVLGENEDAVAQAIFAMEQDKVICGYHTLINWNKTSKDKVIAMIEVKVTPQRGIGFDKIASRIYHFSEVNAVYLISGGFDLLVMLEGKSMQEVAMFVSDKLSTLDSVLSTATHFVLKKYKEHGAVLVGESKRERMLITP